MTTDQTKISPEFIQNAARVLKTLGHPDRIKIVEFLENGEKSVSQIHKELEMHQPIVSQHLKVMYDRGIVTNRQDGTRYFYSLANEFIIKYWIVWQMHRKKLQKVNGPLNSMIIKKKADKHE